MEYENVRLLYSATWTVAVAAFVFIVCSLLVERLVYFIGHVAIKQKRIAIYAAFEKIKEELMLVGFISIALTLGQNRLSSICVPSRVVNIMRQCNNETIIELLKEETNSTCTDGNEPFIHAEGLHQLHILIFTWVFVHVVYSVVVMGLGTWKVHLLRSWEEKAREEYEDSSSHGHRLTKSTTFVQTRMFSENQLLSYMYSFFRMFYNPVSETDYITLRNGFIMSHMPKNVEFDFHKYIMRTLHDDLKHVVGISPYLWGYAILTLLLNIDGWEVRVWAALIPIIMVVVIGTNLQSIVSKMASEIAQKHSIVDGIPNVKLGDELFLFKRPKLVLSLIKFTIFQNATDMATELWAIIIFDKNDCMFQNKALTIVMIALGVVSLIICGFVILPIYALVSQMGTNLKKTVFPEQVQMAIKRWHKEATRAVN